METSKNEIRVQGGGIVLNNLEEMWRMACMFAKSGLCSFETPEEVIVVLQGGSELGFKPWQSLQSLHVVNGRLGIEGSALAGLIRRSGVLDYMNMSFSGMPFEDTFTAVIISKRKGESAEYMTVFSVADAKLAKLWGTGKDNWVKYPKDMLTWRAMGRHARLYYSDVTQGFYTVDELEQIEPTAAPLTPSNKGGIEGLKETLTLVSQTPKPEANLPPVVTIGVPVVSGAEFEPETPGTAPWDIPAEPQPEQPAADPSEYKYTCKKCKTKFNNPTGQKKNLCPACLSNLIEQSE